MTRPQRAINVATTQYLFQPITSWESYRVRLESLIKNAKAQNAELLVLPEYAGEEIAGLLSQDSVCSNEALQVLVDDYVRLFQDLAKTAQIYILAGSLPVRAQQGGYYNRAFLFSPQGELCFQDKVHLTPGERLLDGMQTADELKVFDTQLGKLAIAICYDSEFPALVHAYTKAGAELILVPSCTSTMQGSNRVSICCRARAIENQCFVVKSTVLVRQSNCSFSSTTVGQAGIYSPIDGNFPDDGIICEGEVNTEALLVGTLAFDQLHTARERGQMRNFQDACEVDLQRYQVVKQQAF